MAESEEAKIVKSVAPAVILATFIIIGVAFLGRKATES